MWVARDSAVRLSNLNLFGKTKNGSQNCLLLGYILFDMIYSISSQSALHNLSRVRLCKLCGAKLNFFFRGPAGRLRGAISQKIWVAGLARRGGAPPCVLLTHTLGIILYYSLSLYLYIYMCFFFRSNLWLN